MLAPTRVRRRRQLSVEALERRAMLVGDLVDIIGSPEYFDIFLDLSGVPGSSTDSKHAGTIEIESFSWGVSNPGMLTRAGRTSPQDLHFLAPVDISTPALLNFATNGQHIPSAVLSVRKAGGENADFLTVKLEDVLITSYQVRSLNQEFPLEEVSLRFARITETFTPQTDTGEPGTPVTETWVVPTNVPRAAGGSLLEQKVREGTAGAQAAVDAFIWFSEISGGTADNPNNQIEVLSFHWGVTQSGGTSASRSSSVLTMHDLHVVTPLDKTTPLLLKALVENQHTSDVVLRVQKVRGESSFMQVKLSDVLISGFNIQSTNETEPLAEFSLNFAKLTEIVESEDTSSQAVASASALTSTTGQWNNAERRARYVPGPSLIDITLPSESRADLFVKLDGIDGSSTHEDHVNELEIESFSWGAVRSIPTRGGPKDGTSPATFEDIHMVSQAGKASPKLMLACASGQHIAKAILHVRKAGGDQHEYLTVKLTDILVSSYSVQSDSESLPLEEFALNFATLHKGVTAQSETGAPGTTTSANVNRFVGRRAAPYAAGDALMDETDSEPGDVDTFLKLDNIAGDVTHEGFKGQIDLDSFRFGMRRTDLASASARSSVVPKLAFEEFQGAMDLSQASPLLFAAVANGTRVPNAEVSILPADRSGEPAYLTVKMQDVLVSSYNLRSTNESLPTESISMNYSKVIWTYTPPPGNNTEAPDVAIVQAGRGGFKFEAGVKIELPDNSSSNPTMGFVKWGNVQGDSTVEGHEGEIELLSFSFGVSNSSSSLVRTASASPNLRLRTTLDDVHLVTTTSQATPQLLNDALAGKHVPTAVISLRKAGENQSNFYVVKLTDILVTGYQTSASKDEQPLEEIAFNFSNVIVEYELISESGQAAQKVHGEFKAGRSRPATRIGESLLRFTQAPAAPTALFVKIEGIPGDATQENHKNEIAIESFSWGFIRPVSSSTGGAGAGKIKFNEFTIKKTSDKASPAFFKNCVNGTHIPSAVISIDRLGDSSAPQTFYQVKLEDILVSSFQHTSSSDSIPTDQFSLNFGRIKLLAPAGPSGPTTPNTTDKSRDEAFAAWD